jgi:hypothetical protein
MGERQEATVKEELLRLDILSRLANAMYKTGSSDTRRKDCRELATLLGIDSPGTTFAADLFDRFEGYDTARRNDPSRYHEDRDAPDSVTYVPEGMEFLPPIPRDWTDCPPVCKQCVIVEISLAEVLTGLLFQTGIVRSSRIGNEIHIDGYGLLPKDAKIRESEIKNGKLRLKIWSNHFGPTAEGAPYPVWEGRLQ